MQGWPRGPLPRHRRCHRRRHRPRPLPPACQPARVVRSTSTGGAADASSRRVNPLSPGPCAPWTPGCGMPGGAPPAAGGLWCSTHTVRCETRRRLQWMVNVCNCRGQCCAQQHVQSQTRWAGGTPQCPSNARTKLRHQLCSALHRRHGGFSARARHNPASAALAKPAHSESGRHVVRALAGRVAQVCAAADKRLVRTPGTASAQFEAPETRWCALCVGKASTAPPRLHRHGLSLLARQTRGHLFVVYDGAN